MPKSISRENKKNISKSLLKIWSNMLSINPFMPSGFFYLNSLDQSSSSFKGCPVSFYYYHVFIKMPVINANSVDPDSVASDLGLHCLQMSHLWKLGING